MPAWARLLDAAMVGFLILAVAVAVFGGFRARVFSLRLSLTSAPLLLLYAVAAAVVRHLLLPRRPVYQRFWLWVRESVRSEAFEAAWPMFLTTRLAVFVVGYLAILTFGYAPLMPPYKMFDNEVLNLPIRWDAGWYLGVANVGYEWDENAVRHWRYQNVAFFPAFPILMRIGGRLIGDRPALAGQVLSLAAFLAALVYLFRLARETLDHRAPGSALAFLAAYPFAVFFGALYTEGLFLLSAVAAFYHFHRREYGRASAWGLLAGLSRPNGAFLSVALAVLAVQSWWDQPKPTASAKATARLRQGFGVVSPELEERRRTSLAEARFARRRKLRPTGDRRPTGELRLVGKRIASLGAAAAPGIGMMLFSAYLFSFTGRPFAWMQAHEAWGRTYHGLDWFAAQKFREFVDGFYLNPAALPIELMNGAATALALALVWPIVRRFGLAYGVFVLVNLIPPLVAGGLVSMGRLTSVLFPVFLWLGEAVPASRRPAWIVAFGMGQAFGAAMFFTWRPFV